MVKEWLTPSTFKAALSLNLCSVFKISEITFLDCDRTERNNIRVDRLENIALSAIKQSNQYFLPKINNLINYDKF